MTMGTKFPLDSPYGANKGYVVGALIRNLRAYGMALWQMFSGESVKHHAWSGDHRWVCGSKELGIYSLAGADPSNSKHLQSDREKVMDAGRSIFVLPPLRSPSLSPVAPPYIRVHAK
ncbi:hypothetical protein GOP47_0003639 [Adiantum capillus-veneris]|uniref:Uncharacterized protein n=1 Tax=Adiantum capillus-veneris TaxID=13818 RepID=A0A9D4ZP02_ADICA|nr:hypothetical protein GOP47_0003639 [Adiantum capillus-veneris]